MKTTTVKFEFPARPRPSRLRRVLALDDLDFLLKEAELVTGHPGMILLFGRGRKRLYRIGFNPCGYDLALLGSCGETGVVDLVRRELLESQLRSGNVYVSPLPG